MAVQQRNQIRDVSITHPGAKWRFRTSKQNDYGSRTMSHSPQKHTFGAVGGGDCLRSKLAKPRPQKQLLIPHTKTGLGPSRMSATYSSLDPPPTFTCQKLRGENLTPKALSAPSSDTAPLKRHAAFGTKPPGKYESAKMSSSMNGLPTHSKKMYHPLTIT